MNAPIGTTETVPAEATPRQKPAAHKRTIVINGRKTSLNVEDEIWSAFKEIAAARRQRLVDLVDEIALARYRQTLLAKTLSGALREFVRNVTTAAAA